MEETYQIIEGTPTLHDLDAENGFLWCPGIPGARTNRASLLAASMTEATT